MLRSSFVANVERPGRRDSFAISKAGRRGSNSELMYVQAGL